MFPQVQSVFLNWLESVQLKVIQKTAVDFELLETTLNVVTLDMVLQAMSPEKVERKPENQRIWKFWDGWSTSRVELDTTLQDPEGRQYKVQSVNDWSQGGFFHYELTEQPLNLDQP